MVSLAKSFSSRALDAASDYMTGQTIFLDGGMTL